MDRIDTAINTLLTGYPFDGIDSAKAYLRDIAVSHAKLIHEMKTCDRSIKSESWYAALKAAEGLT